MDYITFNQLFQSERLKLKLSQDISEHCHHEIVNSQVWAIEWELQFPDGTYVRINEHYTRRAGMIGESRRAAFSFHYGQIVNKDSDGRVIWGSNDPVGIRIDDSMQPAHLHYGTDPKTHYLQVNVEGINLADMDMFTFLRAVLRHRRKGISLETTFKFKII